MYPSGNLLIPVEHGQLEAILKEPRTGPRPKVWPLFFIRTHSVAGPCTTRSSFAPPRALNDAGLITLRINFRGVGQSTGEHDEGRGERDDVRAGLDYLSANYPNSSTTLCGFSFGARVGLEVGICRSARSLSDRHRHAGR